MRIYYSGKYSGTREDSHRLLAQAMDRYLVEEIPNSTVSAEELLPSLKTGPKGKPYVPEFPPFSISHTGELWAVLIDTEECGLDVQEVKTVNSTKMLAMRFYTIDESAAVCARGDGEFFRLWARREAFRKAKGESVFSEEESVLFDRVNDDGKIWSVKDIELPFPVYAAICTSAEREETRGLEELIIEAL